jgi:hypothetical protein
MTNRIFCFQKTKPPLFSDANCHFRNFNPKNELISQQNEGFFKEKHQTLTIQS